MRTSARASLSATHSRRHRHLFGALAQAGFSARTVSASARAASISARSRASSESRDSRACARGAAAMSPAIERRQQLAVLLTNRNQLGDRRERILPEHLADLLHRRLLRARGLLLRLLEQAFDRSAAGRLAVPADHRFVHQVGVGALLRRCLTGRGCELRQQLAHLRFVGGALDRASAAVPTACERARHPTGERERCDDKTMTNDR